MNRYSHYKVYIGVFAGLLLALYLMMVVSALIPNAAIQKHMRSSAALYANTERYTFSEDGVFQNVADNYADQLWLNIGWNLGNGNPFRRTLETRFFDGGLNGAGSALYRTVSRGAAANADYSRYWHGTAALLRVAHLITDIRGVKILGMFSLCLLVLNTLRALWRKGHGDLGIYLVLSLLLVQVWNLGLSVEYQPSFLICFAMCPAFLRLEDQNDFYLKLLCVISGTLTAFFDFLTTETMTFLIPMLLVLAIRSRERRLTSPGSTLKLLVKCGLCWLLAYGGAFVVKWCLVSLVNGGDQLLHALQSVGKRLGGNVTVGQVQKRPDMFMAIGANFSVLFEGTSRTEYRKVIGYLVFLGVVVLVVWRLYQTRRKLRPGTGFLLLLGSVVLLRYSVLANHSYMHAFFTYRALSSTILACLLAIVVNLQPEKRLGGWKWS